MRKVADVRLTEEVRSLLSHSFPIVAVCCGTNPKGMALRAVKYADACEMRFAREMYFVRELHLWCVAEQIPKGFEHEWSEARNHGETNS